MKLNEISFTFSIPIEKIEECKSFYQKYFNSTISFDCGWYVVINFESECGFCIGFMTPQDNETPLYGNGVTINIMVDDVDAEYSRISATDIKINVPIADQPWGDRSFRITDPIGNTLYIYSNRQPSEEYKQAFK